MKPSSRNRRNAVPMARPRPTAAAACLLALALCLPFVGLAVLQALF